MKSPPAAQNPNSSLVSTAFPYQCSIEGKSSCTSKGHHAPIQHLNKPGLQTDLAEDPASTHIPTDDGGYQLYKAAGKLSGKRAIITGGDSGIGRAIALLFAMEGASSLIVYLPEEEKDAQETKRRVQEFGCECHCLAIDLRRRKTAGRSLMLHSRP